MLDIQKGGRPTSYESAKTMMGEEDDFDSGLDADAEIKIGTGDTKAFDQVQAEIAKAAAERAQQEATVKARVAEMNASRGQAAEHRAVIKADLEPSLTVHDAPPPQPKAQPKSFWQNLSSALPDVWNMIKGEAPKITSAPEKPTTPFTEKDRDFFGPSPEEVAKAKAERAAAETAAEEQAQKLAERVKGITAAKPKGVPGQGRDKGVDIENSNTVQF